VVFLLLLCLLVLPLLHVVLSVVCARTPIPVMRTCARNGGCKGSVVPSSPQGKSAREQCCQQPAVSVI
jgi:hypothetical protein